jgi:hypothetical protein
LVQGFDFFATDDMADGLHPVLAARAPERIAAPCLEDEVAPEWMRVAGGLLEWNGDEEGFRLMVVDLKKTMMA